MFVEEVCIDGFKSYAQRTVVPAFDPLFNAITGLNGSGKSNILDSICFVLGITNLTQIVVTRQIVIGGRNKYLINGHVAQPTRVQNLFHSVQLNVNNPHFLIMQGRITKVLNMKPPEILGMLEEAAGTRMYESKKEAALKTLDKKQTKVDEIDKLLEEEILPTIEKLRKERGDYMKWASGNDALERLRRFCVAYEYANARAALEEDAVGELKTKIDDLDARAIDRADQSDAIDAEMKRLSDERKAHESGDAKALTDVVEALSKTLVKDQAAASHKKDATQLGDATSAIASADADAKAAALKAKHAEKELSAKKKQRAAKEKEGDKLSKDLSAATAKRDAAVDAYENASGGCTPDRLAELEASRDFAERNVRAAQEKVDVLCGQLAGLDFKFKDPEAKFDRGRVKGVVAALMKVKDPAMSTALEVVAAGKLYQVVVDTEVTGKALLSRGQLQKRVTIIPLNKGDLLNPSGLLTGGSRNNSHSVLAKLHALHEAEKALGELKIVAREASDAAKTAAREAKASEGLEAAVDAAEHALGLVKAKIEGSESHALASAVEALEKDLMDAKAAGEAAKDAKAAATDRASALEKEIASFAKERDARLKEAEKALKLARADVAAKRDEIKTVETVMRDAKVERESAAAERVAIAENVAAAETAVAELEGELAALEAVVASRAKEHDDATKELAKCRAKMAACDEEAAALRKKQTRIERAADADAVERKKLEHKIARVEKEAAEGKARCAKLEEEHPWIASEASRFGVRGGEYDWASRDPDAAAAELADAEAAQATLAKRINKKVIAMFDKAEGEFKALQEKRRIVLDDRKKIQDVIGELDEKKKEALSVTWNKVNADFGSIFSTLLPGTSAKLEPPEARSSITLGESFLAGLEVRVAFGGVWKESLTELSGGQRSLLALSLILALLLFKPAPIYILDEVDAALDLSHTQNIGRMIAQYFPYSQFIVVSLKEGMFNNANCIFRTKFVDGVSTVTRTVPALKDKAALNKAAGDGGGFGVSDAAQKRRAAGAKGKGKEN
ncbi:condensin complex component [Micromonas pusilla CCMP1545]|uniref:Condensin complex component n=1 Tax=Micromonas pusilla (strain CCMP1545) TaxID=564608 RepID=C1N9P3_MICPC|nr:condensin complex component [Micromonas pusilla CCMP1545]EEH50983.1 condensin complex component [Micromonas pusilla CCMP1545]|eukprot:XP_003064649.1 condensin complex component [Micromonas pusilla CCMP1545]